MNEENLANQIAVVKEEIRVNVLNQPYGGFPWLTLPPVLFETFPNAHNGYGGFEDLEAATVENAQDFFARYYAPGNAVLAVGGDFDPDAAMVLVAPALRRRASAYRPGAARLRRARTDLRATSRAGGPAGARSGDRAGLAGPRPGRPRRLPPARRAHRGAVHR